MKKMKYAAALLSSVALVAALGGCASSSSSSEGATDGGDTAAAASNLDTVKAEGKVQIGIGNNNPPMNYIDDNGNWTGFDVDLANAIADQLGVEAELVEVDNDTRISYLMNGTTDMSITNLSHTIERDEQIDFAEPSYIWDGKVAIAKKGQFKELTDLAGKKVAVDQGSSAYKAIEEAIAEAGLEPPIVETYQGNAACFEALADGKVDAFAQDSIICAGVAGDAYSEYEPVGGFFSGSLYGIGVPSNDSAWRDAVSFALQELEQNGTYDEIYSKWFGDDGLYPLGYDVRPLLGGQFGDNQLYYWPN